MLLLDKVDDGKRAKTGNPRDKAELFDCLAAC